MTRKKGENTINLDNIARSIALVSDTHVLSDYALVPREPLYASKFGDDGRWLNPPEALSKGQIEIQEDWYDKFLPICDEFRVDTVMHFGDACQGCNPREGGIDCLTPDIDYQIDAVEAVMKPLVKGRIYHQLSGTLYHEALDVRIHRELVRRLKPICKAAYFHGKFANIAFKGTNKIMNCAHAATSALIYPATVIDREMTFLKMAVAEGRVPKADYLVRGHLHRYIHIDYPDIHGIQLPGWMTWFPLGDKVRLYGRTQPDIGGMILLIDKLNRTILLHFLYRTPNIIDFVRSG